MKKPIINPISEKILLASVDNLPQSLILSGESGVGLSTISMYIAYLCDTEPIIILPEKDEKIDLDRGIISIDIIRRLYNDTKTKTTKKRIFIIDYAQRMTHQAQNAFLKLLEEPNSGIHFILVSDSTSKLLPTITSRVQNIPIKQINDSQSIELLNLLGEKNEKKRSQMLFIANGLPAELTRLSSDGEYFEKRVNMVRDARELLRGDLYSKLLLIQLYKDDRQSVLLLLNDSVNILQKSFVENPKNETIKHIDSLLMAYQRIEANGNIRLCLTQMVI